MSELHLVRRSQSRNRATGWTRTEHYCPSDDALPESARQTVREIKKLTNKPVRYVVNTHWHSDHHYGNAIYREAYPGVEFIGHPYTRHMVLTSDMPDLVKNIEVEYPADIARIQKALDTGKRSNGDPLTPEYRKILEERIVDYRLFIKDMKVTPVIPSTLTVADSLVLERRDRSIVINTSASATRRATSWCTCRRKN